jgi:hypothetical protein
MGQQFYRKVILPAVGPVGVTIAAAILIIGIGEILLALFVHGTPDLERLELWFGVLLSLVVLGGCGFLATRVDGSLGPLERELAIGRRPMFAQPLPPVDLAARRGPSGTIADLAEGYVLYARNGALARVIDVLPGGEEHGRVRRGLLYAQGMHGASDQLWIPFEAVSAVFPETHSAFLAIKGDETEAFGWDRPPAAFARHAPKPGPLGH